MNKCYLTVGTSNIKSELMRKISDVSLTNSHAKPNGGLWLTDYNLKYQNINSWMDNITSFSRIDTLYNTKYYGRNILSAAVVMLKDDANIFVLDSEKKLNELMLKYPHNEALFSYEAIAKDYDGIYVNCLGIPQKYYSAFLSFDVPSLILFNTNPIDYYKEAKIKIHSLERLYGDFILPADYTIEVSDEKKYINNADEKYERMVDEIGVKIRKYWQENKEYYSQNLRSYFIYVYDYIMKYYAKKLYEISKDEQSVNDMCYTISCNIMPKK